MFTADDIQTRVRQQPFTPLRIVTSSGESFDIYHPDLIMVGRRYLILGTASTENPRQFDKETRVAVMHVTALADLPVSAPPGGNGQ
jgi:hypothetical protein